MKPFAMILTFAFVTLSAFSQMPADTLTVHKDARIDHLIQKQVEINEYTTRNARRTAKGFRIQVINTTDRNAAIEAKTTVYRLYPELKAYLMYQSPYFRLRVGNFETRDEAESYQRQLAREFKQNVYIVNDTIEVNPDKSGDL